jgi:hypothetical protein
MEVLNCSLRVLVSLEIVIYDCCSKEFYVVTNIDPEELGIVQIFVPYLLLDNLVVVPLFAFLAKIASPVTCAPWVVNLK